MSAALILMIIALICLFLAAIPLPWQNPINLFPLGMFFWGLSLIVGK